MSSSYSSNTAAFKAAGQLSRHTKNLTENLQRLSSGLRINKASDDAAGISVASLLNAETRTLTVAIRNANEGISLVDVADGALEQIGNILTRMAEVAEISINGTLQNVNRSPLQAEWLALSSEVTRIARTTSFNGINLLVSTSGQAHQFTFQVGTTSSVNSRIVVQGVEATLSALHLGFSGDSLSFSVIDTTIPGSVAAATSALEAAVAGIEEVSRLRGGLGASASRLDFAVSNLQVTRIEVAQAESNIRDADIATEAAKYTRNLILQQASAAILAQANIQPQRALDLLS